MRRQAILVGGVLPHLVERVSFVHSSSKQDRVHQLRPPHLQTAQPARSLPQSPLA